MLAAIAGALILGLTVGAMIGHFSSKPSSAEYIDEINEYRAQLLDAEEEGERPRQLSTSPVAELDDSMGRRMY